MILVSIQECMPAMQNWGFQAYASECIQLHMLHLCLLGIRQQRLNAQCALKALNQFIRSYFSRLDSQVMCIGVLQCHSFWILNGIPTHLCYSAPQSTVMHYHALWYAALLKNCVCTIWVFNVFRQPVQK